MLYKVEELSKKSPKKQCNEIFIFMLAYHSTSSKRGRVRVEYLWFCLFRCSAKIESTILTCWRGCKGTINQQLSFL